MSSRGVRARGAPLAGLTRASCCSLCVHSVWPCTGAGTLGGESGAGCVEATEASIEALVTAAGTADISASEICRLGLLSSSTLTSRRPAISGEYGTVESCETSPSEAAPASSPCPGSRPCPGWRTAHCPPPVRVGLRQRRFVQACFFTPLPPNLGLSRQLGQRPQSARLHPSQAPQRSTRSTLTTDRFDWLGLCGWELDIPPIREL